MYLSKLFNLARLLPDLTEQNLKNIDNFLGRVGSHNIFTKKQFLAELTQKQYSDVILNWLLKNEILKPKYILCPNCYREIAYQRQLCDFCDTKIDSSAEVNTYEVLSELSISLEEKEAKENNRFKLDKVCFEILLKRLDQKIRHKENSYMIFSDIAASTVLKEINPIARDKICRDVPRFLKDLTLPFFRSQSGIYIKTEGDASYILLDSLNEVMQFMQSVNAKCKSEDFYSEILSANEEIKDKILKSTNAEEKEKLSKSFTFIKFYVAKSPTGQYTQTDTLSIDFDNTLESIIFIKRIEKEVKPQILFQESDLTINAPLCIFSRENNFDGIEKKLENVTNYGDVPIWYSDYEKVKSFFLE